MISNFCKKREWNTLNKKDGSFYHDYYFTYYLNKKGLGSYLNTWFVNRLEISNGITYYDSLITLKKVDNDTSSYLYNRPFNPLTICILPKIISKDKKKSMNISYTMVCRLHSIDDSSFGIWWDGTNLIDDLKTQRLNLIKWINQFNTKKLLNGEKLLEKCIELGANPDEKDYD